MGLRYRYESVYKELFTYNITDHERVLIEVDCAKGNEVTPEWVAYKTQLDVNRVAKICDTLSYMGRIRRGKKGFTSKIYNRQTSLENMSILQELARETFKQ